jgi:hypothetical protein
MPQAGVLSIVTKGQSEMTQLSGISSQFDRFLFAPLHENGEAPLSVLSALARQDIDAWQEADRLAQLPKDHAVNSLASTIWKSDSERWSPSEASIVAARLIELLPSPNNSLASSTLPDNAGGKLLMMWLVYGIIFGSIAITGNLNVQSRNSNHPDQTNMAVGQHEMTPKPSQTISTD